MPSATLIPSENNGRKPSVYYGKLYKEYLEGCLIL